MKCLYRMCDLVVPASETSMSRKTDECCQERCSQQPTYIPREKEQKRSVAAVRFLPVLAGLRWTSVAGCGLLRPD